MDWAKAKTILIIVLLIFCLGLSGILINKKVEEKKETEKSIAAVTEYLNNVGVTLSVDIPKERPSLPVLFVEYRNEGSKELNYKKYSVYTNTGSSKEYSIASVGKEKAKVVSASSALMNALSQATEDPSTLKINQVELCYIIGNTDALPEVGSKDTAIPAWKISTNNGVFYILAY